ncbi:MAG: hypothetical protein RDU01_07460 [Thermodesulfovibrionales bacterium]|nr:hypothetical protein [Thermodesulfovibrionales bacterium]
MAKIKPTKCQVCGNETLQGATCALCRSGIPQIHKELIDLLMQDENPALVKKQKVSKR